MNETDCRYINNFKTGWEKCDFLKNHKECLSEDSLFDYMQFTFCVLDSSNYFIPIVFTLFFLFILFISLGTTADDFLCPSLLVISKTLRLSQNIAGVTFLAFGNSAPDIFSSLAGIKQTRTELVIGELFGSGIFVTLVVVGSIFLTQNFVSMKRPILRDIVFYLFACYFAWATVWHGSISFYHSLVFILFYFVYLAVVILSRIINQRLKKNKTLNKKNELEKATSDFQCTESYQQQTIVPVIDKVKSSNLTKNDNFSRSDCNSNIITEEEKIKTSLKKSLVSPQSDEKFGIDNAALDIQENNVSRRSSHSLYHFDNTVYHITHSMEQDDYPCINPDCKCSEKKNKRDSLNQNEKKIPINTANSPSFGSISVISNNSLYINQNSDDNSLVSSPESSDEFIDFLIHICPIDVKEWNNLSYFSRFFQIVKAPILFLLITTIPVVDYEIDRQNWCRYLNSLHIITTPITILLITGLYEIVFEHWSKALFLMAILIALAFLVFKYTNKKVTPKYHYLYGYLGFVVSVLWIYALATETVSLLHCLGIMLNASDFILGLTILAWGNSLGDLFSNLSMARNGFAEMGISACFGGPLFNLLFGIGLPYCLLLYNNDQKIEINYSKMVTLSFVIAVLGLSTIVSLLLYSDFKSKRFHGFILLTIYFVYVILAGLIELDFV